MHSLQISLLNHSYRIHPNFTIIIHMEAPIMSDSSTISLRTVETIYLPTIWNATYSFNTISICLKYIYILSHVQLCTVLWKVTTVMSNIFVAPHNIIIQVFNNCWHGIPHWTSLGVEKISSLCSNLQTPKGIEEQ